MAAQNYLVETKNVGYDSVRNIPLVLSNAFNRLRKLDINEALRRMKSTVKLFVIIVNIDFLEGGTLRVVFQSDISDSLPLNQGTPRKGLN